MTIKLLQDPDNTTRNLPNINFDELVRPKPLKTRAQDNAACVCSICKIGQLSGAEYLSYDKGQRQQAGRPRLREEEVCVPVTTCSYCHTEVGQGRPHDCTRTDMQANLFGLIRSHSEKTQEQVTSKMLDAIFQEKGVSKQGGVALIATKGTPKSVTVGKSRAARPSPKFSIEDLTRLQVTRNFSDKDTLAVANFLRVKAGRQAVEPNLKNGLKERNHRLEDMFFKKEMEMKVKPKKKGKDDSQDEVEQDGEDVLDQAGMKTVMRPGVFVSDLEQFTQFLIDERCLDPQNHIVQFGFDDGQGMLKIMEIVKSKDVIDDQDRKRSKYADGVCPRSSKLSSVKKLFVVGLIPDVQEIYPNVKTMLEELNLEGIEYGLSADIKIYLCVIGKQIASCVHSCPYCEGQAPWDETYKSLTIASLFEWNQKFLESGGNKKNAKFYQNVINKPLLTGDDDTKTLEVLNPPELHLMTGILGKLIMEMERKAFEDSGEGEAFVTEFLKEEDISRCVYQGSRSFEGNQARKLLKNVDKLERKVMTLDMEVTIEALPFIQALRLFEKVVTSCFGQTLHPGYENNVDAFARQYRALDISVTPKVNLVTQNM